MPARVVLAMSGGVDSSVAAYLLKKQGHEVIGLFMRTGAHGGDSDAQPQERLLQRPRRRRRPPGRRPARHAVLCARFRARVRAHHRLFRRRIPGRPDAEPVRGLQQLAEVRQALVLSASNWKPISWPPAITPKSSSDDGGPELHQAVDPDKDQSYVLHGICGGVCCRTSCFPIGGYRKAEIRDLAREAGLGVADKPDSVEICFVPDNDHGALIRRRRPDLATAGNFVDPAGNVLAAHAGIENYTIGQRKGLGYAAGQRRYVLEIVPETNARGPRRPGRFIGPWPDRLASTGWWMSPPESPLACTAKIRYHHTPTPAARHGLTQWRRPRPFRRAAKCGHARTGRRFLRWFARAGRRLD